MTPTWSRFADIFYTNGDLLKFDLEAVCVNKINITARCDNVLC